MYALCSDLLKKGTSPGGGNVFATHPNVKVIVFGDFFGTKLAFGH
jgi:hypothetical protein